MDGVEKQWPNINWQHIVFNLLCYGMFGAMGNLCCNLLVVDMCLKFGVL
jgi:hypothetical protein